MDILFIQTFIPPMCRDCYSRYIAVKSNFAWDVIVAPVALGCTYIPWCVFSPGGLISLINCRKPCWSHASISFRRAIAILLARTFLVNTGSNKSGNLSCGKPPTYLPTPSLQLSLLHLFTQFGFKSSLVCSGPGVIVFNVCLKHCLWWHSLEAGWVGITNGET